MATPSFLCYHSHYTTTDGGKLPDKRKQTENDQPSSFRLFLRLGFGSLGGLGRCDGELIRLDGLLQISEASLDVPVNRIGRPFDVAYKAALFFRGQLGAAVTHLIKLKHRGVQPEFLRRYINTQQLADYPLWVADYRGYVSYGGNYGMWQYSSVGQVSGVNGNVDLNYSYKDYLPLIRAAGKNGYQPESDPDEPDYYELWRAAQDKLDRIALILAEE